MAATANDTKGFERKSSEFIMIADPAQHGATRASTTDHRNPAQLLAAKSDRP